MSAPIPKLKTYRMLLRTGKSALRHGGGFGGQSPRSSLGRKRNFFARAREVLRDFTPDVQVGSASDAAAMQTPVRRHCCKSQFSCKPSRTPAQKASPAPAEPR